MSRICLPSTSSVNVIEQTPSGQEVTKTNRKPDEPYIRIRVINSDMTNEIHFRLKSEVALSRMKKAYASKMGQNPNELRFVFDGVRITDHDTPKKLGIIDEDVVEVYQERIGGGM